MEYLARLLILGKLTHCWRWKPSISLTTQIAMETSSKLWKKGASRILFYLKLQLKLLMVLNSLERTSGLLRPKKSSRPLKLKWLPSRQSGTMVIPPLVLTRVNTILPEGSCMPMVTSKSTTWSSVVKDRKLYFLIFSIFIIPGTALLNNGLMGFVYLVWLTWMFVGVAIISDIFMESIEVITS